MHHESGPDYDCDASRHDHVRNLMNRAARLYNRLEIDGADVDDKGLIHGNEPTVETELRHSYAGLNEDMLSAGLDLKDTIGAIRTGRIIYDETYEEPFGTSDLPPEVSDKRYGGPPRPVPFANALGEVIETLHRNTLPYVPWQREPEDTNPK